jgi:bifunctional UDP-N-acetylglucosamine pyrophosphorylase/glucosamine-1-phosphate N-acetyltransferase
MSLSVIILAAGQSKRMRTTTSKVLHPLGGIPMIERVINTARELNPNNIYVVYGNGGSQVKELMQHLPVQWIKQENQLGTGHAVLQALPNITKDEQVLVLYGDVPLITKETLQQLLKETANNAIGILVANLKHPAGYGRVLRNKKGNIIAIVEEKDTNAKQKKITEINTGILIAQTKLLKKWLPKVKNNNVQSEYYLPDIIPLAVKEKKKVVGVISNSVEETQGINNRVELAKLERYYQTRAAQQLMLQGVSIIDPQRFDLRGELIAEQDVTIDINVVIEGKVSIGAGSKIGPNVILRNAVIGKNVEILPNSMVDDAKIADQCKIGPFARIRPGTELAENVHVGNFVELKKSKLGAGSKANHLSYLGDAVIGKNVNVGAGVITCNYDGVSKYQTTIMDGAFIGSDSQLIAPVTIGEKAYIGSGSTISHHAPAGKLTLSRAKQVTLENWKAPIKKS